jgi:hypothetical protein
MRIAYVSLHWLRTLNSGVGKKIQRQITAWENAGHEVKFFMHAAKRMEESPLVPGEIVYYTESSKLVNELRRISAIYPLLDAVQAFHPDLVYIRYGMYVYPVHRLAEIAPLVEEITTNDLSQHGGLGLLYGMYNRLTRGILIGNTSGLVCLSHELANAPFNAKYKRPTHVIGDGMDMENIQPLPAPSNQNPQIAFIGSPDSIWQGVDKLPALARACPDLGIHIIGYDRIENHKKLPENLYLYGYLNTEAYKKVLAGMDCAIGSLALHRIQLNESSPLKTRECLAFGLPMILPYHDTDLNHLDSDFLLKIPNTEDNIHTHANVIREFAYRMRGMRVDRTVIAHLSQAVKEKERLMFFEKILNNSRKKE